MISRVPSRFVLAVGLLCLAAASAASAAAQGGAAAPASAPTPSGVKRVTVAKSVFGDAGMIVNARSDGYVEVAAAGPKKTVLLQLRTMAARAWVDSTQRMLRFRPRRSNTPRTFRSDAEEFGTSGTMAITRKVTAGESEYALFFSDDPLTGFTIPVEKSEAEVFIAQVRKATALSAKLMDRPDTTAKSDSAPPKKGKPAVKRSTRPAPKPSVDSSAAPADPFAKPTTPPAKPPAKPPVKPAAKPGAKAPGSPA